MNKTVWQWAALIAYFIGLIANIGAWIALHTWLWNWLTLITAATWGFALWCVLFRPVNKEG